jgi:hypothetical protein
MIEMLIPNLFSNGSRDAFTDNKDFQVGRETLKLGCVTTNMSTFIELLKLLEPPHPDLSYYGILFSCYCSNNQICNFSSN